MFIKLYPSRLLTGLFGCFLLCHCSLQHDLAHDPRRTNDIVEKRANPYPLPSAEYLAQAKTQQGLDKQRSLILAAGRMITRGQWRQGEVILAQTSDLTVPLADEKNILLAQIALLRAQPQTTLARLASLQEKDKLTAVQQIKMHQLAAQAYQKQHQFLAAINERLLLAPLLSSNAAQTRNEHALWLLLTQLPTQELETLIASNPEQVTLQGWLQLALLARQHKNQPEQLLTAVEQWRVHFKHHAGQRLLLQVKDKVSATPQQIALLLPLSGALQGPGNAILDGFMSAAQQVKGVTPVTIKTYDTSKKEVALLYQQAINDGADYVVGPLVKSQVATIAALAHPVPTLLLNDAQERQDNAYLFGLSPLHEASQVALKAHSKGYAKALVIAPADDWGKEVTRAFEQQWQKLGGKLLGVMSYNAHDDLNKKIQDFLHVSSSQQREKQLKAILGQKISTLTSRRQDFDMIFLLAYPSKARQIMPLLKYYYAADIPVFATASVYSGSANALKDKDLDGIMFCDMPWVFAHQMGARNWPEQFNSYNRLYALGKESYDVATQLNPLKMFPATATNEGEGILYLTTKQQVARVFEWGQFQQGLVRSLGETA